MRLRVTGLLGALGFAAAAISLAGFFGAWAWWLDILSHFRVQYALGFLLLALVFALGRKWRGCAGAILLALINAAPVLLHRWPPAPPAPANRPAYRAMLMNVNCARGDPAAVRTAISNARPDLLVLEEISPRWLGELAPALEGFPYREIAPRHDNFGIGLFSRHPLASARVAPFGLLDVPSVFAEVVLDGQPLRVVATHPLPPGNALLAAERDRQLAWIARETAALPRPVLLLGDLNTSPWSPAYRRFMRTCGLRDSARGRPLQPTWPATIPWLWIPLDHILHSPDMALHARAAGPYVGSDHFPVAADFSLRPAP